MRKTRGGTGPRTHVATALEALRMGRGTHRNLKEAADSRSQTGSSGGLGFVSEDSEAERMCRSRLSE